MLERAYKVIDWLGKDGVLHVFFSAVLCSALGWVLPAWAAAVLAMAVGVGKELVWDKWMGRGTFDKKDLVADALGVLLGAL